MTEFESIILGVITGAGTAGAAIKYVAGKSVDSFFDKRLARHRNQLEKELNEQRAQLALEASRETEKLRAVAGVAAKEHEILLSRLQDRRAEVIGELYERLVTTEHLIRVYGTMGNHDGNDNFKAAWDTIYESLQYIDKKQVWLPASCCQKITSFMDQLRSTFSTMHVMRPENFQDPLQQPQASEKWLAAWADMEKKIPAAREVLAEELRKLIEPRADKNGH